MRTYFLILFLMIVACSCEEKVKNVAEESAKRSLELLSVDREFSSMSEKEGLKNAYIEYIDSNGVLLRPSQLPIVSANAIDFLIQQDDADFSLTWNPQHAEVAASGEMGFTYGIYALRPKTYDTIFYGTYTNIWKKQGDGKWKLLLNAGNEGIEQ